MVTGERKHEVVLQFHFAVGRAQQHGIVSDLAHRAVEVGRDLGALDAVFDVGLYPVLHAVAHGGPAVHQGDAGAVPPQVERRLRRRVLAADDQHVRVIKRMRLAVVMENLGQVFAGDAYPVGQVVIAGGHHQLARAVLVPALVAVHGGHAEVAVRAGDGLHALVLADIQLVVRGHVAVVLQRLVTRGLRVGGGERDVADHQQLRRGEKHHVRRVMEERVDQASLVYQQRGETDLLRLDGAGHSRRAGADREHVGGASVALPLRQDRRRFQGGFCHVQPLH